MITLILEYQYSGIIY